MKTQYLCAILLVVTLTVALSSAQDYDDEGYGNQSGGGGGGAAGAGNQGDNEGYQNDDGYSGNMPNYQQNVDSDGSNNNPSSYSPQGSSDADGDYEGDDNSAAASSLHPTVVRVRRSVDHKDNLKAAASEPKLRVKRHGKYYIGPVYTYVKTDKHANFKWGVSMEDF